MAQAARLNLRMQKELKLLITDPPPGASFPFLSSQASSSSAISLSYIDAQIEGPEGSVYEKGVFKLKIQIPERYPFQPPIVTFVTPVYHPNIDTGGRICLDILNLPPKGAWQPSLNISTVLTSIGLLLNEPNPDDGLMHEASREYKYNRQVFDQKARSMTEKYAGVGASEINNGAQSSEALPTASIGSAVAKRSDTSIPSVQDHFVSQKRLCGVTRTLPPESSEPDHERNDAQVMHKVPTSHLYDRQGKVMVLEQESKAIKFEHNKTHKGLEETRKKLSLGLLVPVPKKNDDNKIDVMPTSSRSQPQILLMDPSKPSPLVQPGSSSQPNPEVNKDNQPTCNSTETRLEDESQSLASRQGFGENDKKPSFAPQESALQFSSSGSYQSPPLAPHIRHQNEREYHKDVIDERGSNFSRIIHKKLGLSGRRLTRDHIGWNHCPQNDNKENLAPNLGLPLSHIQKNPKSSPVGSEARVFCNRVQIATNSSHSLSGTEQKKTSSSLVECNDMKTNEVQLARQSECLSSPRNMQKDIYYDKKQKPKGDGERYVAGLEKQGEASPSADAVIVLDSEDSEEEQPARSKLSLALRRLQGKRKS